MKFEEFWTKVSELEDLPDTAIHQIPSILSHQAKMKLCKKTPEEAAGIISLVIDEINKGSVETVDALILKKMK